MEQNTHWQALRYINQYNISNHGVYLYVKRRVLKSMEDYITVDQYIYLSGKLDQSTYLVDDIDNQDEIDFRQHPILILALLIWYAHITGCDINTYYYDLLKDELKEQLELNQLYTTSYMKHRSSGFLLKD